MGWTKQAQATGTNYSGNTIVLTVAVSAGDLIVVGAGSMSASILVTGIADADGNTYTLRDVVASTTSHVRTGRAIAAQANASLQITVTFDTGSIRRNAGVVVARADAGDTIAFDTAASKAGGYEASPHETAAFTTTGDDEFTVAFIQESSTITFSNQEIPSGTAATDIAVGNSADMFYGIHAATLSNAIAEVDTSGSSRYAIEVLAFKATASGGTPQELAGIVDAESSVAGAAQAAKQLAGSVPATSATVGAIEVSHALAGQASATSSAAGAVQHDVNLSGDAPALSEVEGRLSAGGAELEGAVDAQSTLAGALLVQRYLAGEAPAEAALSGALTVIRALGGRVDGISTLTGAAVALKELAGRADAVAILAGDLQIGEFAREVIEAIADSCGVLIAWGESKREITAPADSCGALAEWAR